MSSRKKTAPAATAASPTETETETVLEFKDAYDEARVPGDDADLKAAVRQQLEHMTSFLACLKLRHMSTRLEHAGRRYKLVLVREP